MTYDNEHKFLALAAELEQKQIKREYARIIRRCRDGSYHDFNSELATPKMEMVTDLRNAGLDHEAQKVINGEYDQ